MFAALIPPILGDPPKSYGHGDQQLAMEQELKLNQLEDALTALDYPIDHAAAVEASQGVTLLLADGTESLAAVVADSNADQFDSVDDLTSEVMSNLPRNAVGEPYQSEGEG